MRSQGESTGASARRGGSSTGKVRVGRYELGRTLGEGNFGKVKFARNVDSGEHVAIKILDKENLFRHKMTNQIKREISSMKLIRHPNVIHLHEVMASKIRMYMVLEVVTGGELFDKIVNNGRLKEYEARKYFQQLINAVDYCHSRGVFHRDLKVIKKKGYDGAKADLWSCGVILFVLMAGYLPFEDNNLMALYKKILKADFTCPSWFSSSAKRLIMRILDPNPSTRTTIAEVIENEWFKKGYKPPVFEEPDVSLDDVDALFDETTTSGQLVVERREQSESPSSPLLMNAFEFISTSQGLNLGKLFEKNMGLVRRETRFTTKCTADKIISKIEHMAGPLGFGVKKNNFKMKLQCEKLGRKGQLAVVAEIFEVAPSLYIVEIRKSKGDTLEFHEFYKSLTTELKDIIWRTGDEIKEES